MTSPHIDLGGGNEIEITGKYSKPGEWGLLWYHHRPDGGECGTGGLSWDPDDSVHWDLIQREPLTISPSLRCLNCGAHGWIRAGRWLPA